MSSDALTMRASLDTLPPELYQAVYDLTFTHHAEETGYYSRPPSTPRDEKRRKLQSSCITNAEDRKLMAIDRASRAQYAKSFFESCIWTLAAEDWDWIIDSIVSIRTQYRRMIKEVRICYLSYEVCPLLTAAEAEDEVRRLDGPQANVEIHEECLDVKPEWNDYECL